MQRPSYFLSLILLALASCIGTDFVDEPLGPVPSRLELSDASLSLIEGESQQLSAQVIASDDNPLDVTVSWNSRNPTVATVDPNGLLMAVSAGQVWIDVASQTLEDSLLVTVSSDPEALASITITTSEMNLIVGDTLQLEVELRNADGDVVMGKVLTWESTQPDICSVDEKGQVIALANGITQVTASSEGISSLPTPFMVGSDSLSRSGTFRGLNGYNVEGTAIIEGATGQAMLVFDSDFRAQNGPGLYVYISPNATNVTGGVSLGELKAQSGTQTYEIPANVNPDDFDHVLVYCQPFRVPFGTAEFQ
ncbi:MAG: DM13 domain-containing protein [Bacteroidota bacterium]